MQHLFRVATVVLLPLLMLTGCELLVLEPPGDIAAQQGDLIIYATVLMMIVILPVMALTVFFAVHYRHANKKARYEPEWDHSISLEVVVWSVPLAIIICLAGLTWVATHRLEPYDDVRRISADIPVDPDVQPLTIQVVSMDWKWVFIYPEQGIATVNEMAAIVNRPIEFKLTSDTVMNTFYVPALAGMIYTMAAMETELNAVMNEAGVYRGFSANYSGAGFSQMDFDFHAVDEAGFEQWVETVRAGSRPFNDAEYLALQTPSIDHPVDYFNGIEDGIWWRIITMCVADDVPCPPNLLDEGDDEHQHPSARLTAIAASAQRHEAHAMEQQP